MRFLAVPLLALLIGACSLPSTEIRSGPDRPGGDPLPPPEMFPTPDRPEGRAPQQDVREACRAAPAPRGWIAIRYVAREGECPGLPFYDGYTGVLLQYYADKPVGTMLVVCADQPPPRGWLRDWAPESESCPGARVDEGEPTAVAIRRVR